MPNPQQPEVRRSEKATPTAPSAAAAKAEIAPKAPALADDGDQPVPPANRVGSESGPEQDKPDGEDFVRRMADEGHST